MTDSTPPPTGDPFYEMRRDIMLCRRCPLHEGRKNTVPGEGPEDAKIVLVGEAPGANEDHTGRPFVGRAGKKLDYWLEQSGLAREDVFITNVLKCVSRATRVTLADGSAKTIGEIVRERFTGEVLTVDQASGQFVARRVTGWYRSPRAGRRMFKLRFKHGKANPKGHAGTWLTEDHKVLTDAGWVPASQIRPGAKVATGKPRPGPRTEAMIFGSLLGDACVTDKLQISHCVGQAEWLGLKAAMLAPLKPSIDSVPQNNAVAMRTPCGPYWRATRERFYPAGRKIVPADLQLSPFMLAVWFLDDGHLNLRQGRRPRAEIATNSFQREEVERLVTQLAGLGVECRARWGSGWRIDVTVDGTEALARVIARFVPPSMRYKLHPDYHSVPFDQTAYAPEAPVTFYDEAIVEDGETANTRTDQTLYCIDVEGTHNFVTPGGVVHNCQPPENKFPDSSEDGPVTRCLPHLHQQLRLLNPLAIIVFGKHALNHLVLRGSSDRVLKLDEWVGQVLRRKDMFGETRIGVCFHPAYIERTHNPVEERKCVQTLKTISAYVASRRRGDQPAMIDLREIRPGSTPVFQQRFRLLKKAAPEPTPPTPTTETTT